MHVAQRASQMAADTSDEEVGGGQGNVRRHKKAKENAPLGNPEKTIERVEGG